MIIISFKPVDKTKLNTEIWFGVRKEAKFEKRGEHAQFYFFMACKLPQWFIPWHSESVIHCYDQTKIKKSHDLRCIYHAKFIVPWIVWLWLSFNSFNFLLQYTITECFHKLN